MVDIAELQVGQSISIGDITLPEGITTKTDPEVIVATITVAVEIEEEEEEAVVAVEGEPKVIGQDEKPAEESDDAG